MNNKTNTWAILVNPTLSEVVQRVAFSYGYTWGLTGQEVSNLEDKYLFFLPSEKKITFGNMEDTLNSSACQLVYTLADAMNLFKNPPVVKEAPKEPFVVELNGAATAKFFKDGSVLVRSGNNESVALDKEDFERMIEAYNEMHGIDKTVEPAETMLPVITFNYRAPGQTFLEQRVVAVVEDHTTHFMALDLQDNNQLKRFNVSNIIGPLTFLALDEF